MQTRVFRVLTDNKNSKIDLEFKYLTDKDFEDLSAALKHNTVATELLLGKNDFSDLCAGKLVEVLQGNPNITYLDLSVNYSNYEYKSIICGDGSEDFTSALQKNSTLTHLILDNNRITDDQAGKLIEKLQGNSTLIHLSLRGNTIKNATKLAAALQKNSTLTHLILDTNQITDAQAGELIKKLQGNSTLIHLSLGWNALKNVTKLAAALQNNSSLTTLHLQNNQIDAAGAENLSKALQVNTTLTELNLRSNNIGDIGAKKLAESLKGNSTLVSLNLEHNGIGATGTEALDELVLANNNMIYVYYDNISEEAEGALEERFQLVYELAKNWIEYKDNDTPLPEGIEKYTTYYNAIKCLLKNEFFLRPELVAMFDEDFRAHKALPKDTCVRNCIPVQITEEDWRNSRASSTTLQTTFRCDPVDFTEEDWKNRVPSKEGYVELDIFNDEKEIKDDGSEEEKIEKSSFIKTLSYLVIGGIAGGLLGCVLRASTSLPKDSLIGRLIIPASAITGIALGSYLAISDGTTSNQITRS